MLFLFSLLYIKVYTSNDEGEINHIGHRRTVPWRLHYNGKFLNLRLLIVFDCLYAKLISARWHQAEVYLILSRKKCCPSVVVDTIGVCDMLRRVIGKGGELDGERVVVVAKRETVRLEHGFVGNCVYA